MYTTYQPNHYDVRGARFLPYMVISKLWRSCIVDYIPRLTHLTLYGNYVTTIREGGAAWYKIAERLRLETFAVFHLL